MDTLRGSLTPHASLRGVLGGSQRINGILREGGGTTNYEELENLPAFNGTTIEGDQDPNYYGIAKLTDVPPIINYSIEEQNTGVKWLDGKDIYIRVITATGLYPRPSDWVTIDNIPNIDTIVSIKTMGRHTYTNYSYTEPYITAAYNHNTNDVRYYFSEMSSNGTMTLRIIIKYTKS